jgi:hypothetical protein
MLLPCDALENSQIITLDAEPRVDVFEDCLYLPMNQNTVEDPKGWGLFGRDRRLLPGTGYSRGPAPALVIQHPTTTLDATSVADWGEDDCYVYGGMIQGHYGHFLTGAFARFWSWNRLAGWNFRILCHAYEPIETLFSYPFIAALFAAIGLTQEHFVCPTTPLRLRKLIVPHPSFEELHLAHRDFAYFCHRIGKHVAPEYLRRDDKLAPIYLTKENVTHGLHSVVNEGEITAILRQNGVIVVSPERHNLASQIALFGEDRLIIGFAGAAFHTSIFRPARRMLIMAFSHHIRANFALIDAVNNNQTTYRHLGDTLRAIGPSEQFAYRVAIDDPGAVAESLMRIIDAERQPPPVRYRLPSLVA